MSEMQYGLLRMVLGLRRRILTQWTYCSCLGKLQAGFPTDTVCQAVNPFAILKFVV